jgi:hypothetical protein
MRIDNKYLIPPKSFTPKKPPITAPIEPKVPNLEVSVVTICRRELSPFTVVVNAPAFKKLFIKFVHEFESLLREPSRLLADLFQISSL